MNEPFPLTQNSLSSGKPLESIPSRQSSVTMSRTATGKLNYITANSSSFHTGDTMIMTSSGLAYLPSKVSNAYKFNKPMTSNISDGRFEENVSIQKRVKNKGKSVTSIPEIRNGSSATTQFIYDSGMLSNLPGNLEITAERYVWELISQNPNFIETFSKNLSFIPHSSVEKKSKNKISTEKDGTETTEDTSVYKETYYDVSGDEEEITYHETLQPRSRGIKLDTAVSMMNKTYERNHRGSRMNNYNCVNDNRFTTDISFRSIKTSPILEQETYSFDKDDRSIDLANSASKIVEPTKKPILQKDNFKQMAETKDDIEEEYDDQLLILSPISVATGELTDLQTSMQYSLDLNKDGEISNINDSLLVNEISQSDSKYYQSMENSEILSLDKMLLQKCNMKSEEMQSQLCKSYELSQLKSSYQSPNEFQV